MLGSDLNHRQVEFIFENWPELDPKLQMSQDSDFAALQWPERAEEEGCYVNSD